MKKAALLLTFMGLMGLLLAPPALAADEVKIGVLYSITGSFALAGAEGGQRGSLIALEMWNEQGGVGKKFKIVPVIADAQSNPDVAIREAKRLIEVEKVPVILGVYSSAIAVPLGPICDEAKTILWITIAISDAVLADKHFKYVFRPQPMGSQWGRASAMFLKENLDKLKAKEAKEVKLAVIYEDGPYGVSVSAANLDQAKKDGFNIVLNEGYNHKAQDLSALILKLKASNQDAILHTGYYPDIVLFMKQARELGLKTKGIFGHGAGYANFVNLEKQLGKELAAYLYNADPAPAQVLDPAKLDPSMDPLIKDFLKRYKDKYKEDNPPTHATQGFAHAWMLLKTMDQAVAKYGAPTPDNIRKAALELKIAEGKSPAGYGMDFNPPEDKFAGQNKAAYPVLVQWINQKVEIVWPKALVTQPAKLPLPADAPLAAK